MKVVRQIQSFNRGRDPERLLLKYRAMRASPFGFLRGTCHLFHDRLPSVGILKSAPPVWACGDCHLQNFGSYKGDNRLAYFDLNDFDEAALAPASWDLLRFLTSVRVAAESYSLTAAQAQAACQAFVGAYAAALTQGKAYWVERETAHGLIGDLLQKLRNRARPTFLDQRSTRKGKKRVLIIDGRHALPASPSQREAVTGFMAGFAAAQPNPDFYRVQDVARRVAGCGSLGLDRYAILVQGKGSPDGNYLLDLKLAQASSLVPHLSLAQPPWKSQAHRVVALQRRMQAVAMALMQPVMMDERAYILRSLQPSEDRVALSRPGLSETALTQAIAEMGQIVAWAQLRSAGREGSAIADELIDFGRRKRWRETLLTLSQHCAVQVRKDARTFNAAFDGGAFDV